MDGASRPPRSRGRRLGVHFGLPKDNAEWSTVLTVELVVLPDVVHAVVDGILRFRFLDRAVFVPGVVYEAMSKFGSCSTAVLPAQFVQVVVHLPVGKYLWTENDQVHVGIDVRLRIIDWFCWTFEEPVTPIHVINPSWFLTEGSETRDHFGPRSGDCLLNHFGIDCAGSEPPKGDHSNMMMSFSIEF